MSTKRARFLLISSLAFCLLRACEADVMYTFDYTALSGPVQSFAFSFTAPSFVTAASSPAVTPFMITDGTNSWTITKGLVDNFGCFMFGSPLAQLSGPPPFDCSAGAGGPGGGASGQGGFELLLSFLPSAPGLYVPLGFGGDFGTNDTAAGLEFIGGSGAFHTGAMTLTITAVPEPVYEGFSALSLCVLGGLFAKRKRKP